MALNIKKKSKGTIVRDMPCPQCRESGGDSSGDHLMIFEDGGAYCNRCEFRLKPNAVAALQEEKVPSTKSKPPTLTMAEVSALPSAALPSRGLTEKTLHHFGIKCSRHPSTREVKEYWIPVSWNKDITGYKNKGLEGADKFKGAPVGVVKGPHDLFGRAQCKGAKRQLIICEGQEDACAAWQIMTQYAKGGRYEKKAVHAVSLQFGVKSAEAAIQYNWKFLNKYSEIILALDADDAGEEATRVFAKALGHKKVKVMDWGNDYKDPNALLLAGQEGSEAFVTAFFEAKEYVPSGLISGSAIDFEPLWIPQKPGLALPYKLLNEKLGGAREGEITLLSGTPGCVDRDTEYLSPTGWRSIGDYQEGPVGQYTPQGVLEFVHPIEYIKKPCRRLNHFKGKGVDQVLCDNHNMVYIYHKWNKLKKIRCADFITRHNNSKYGTSVRFLTTFDYSGPGIDMTEGELRLQVAVMADGRVVKAGKDNYTQMRFAKERKYNRVIQLCKQFNLRYDARGWKSCDRYVEGKEWEVIVWPKYPDKRFSDRYWAASREQLLIILDEMVHWDGDQRGRFTSIHQDNLDFIQFAYSATGTRATLDFDKRVDKYSTGMCGTVNPSFINKFVGFQGKGYKPKVGTYLPVDGYKYCFSVPSGMLILRRNGCIFITGNSGKTTFAKGLIHLIARHHKKKVGVFELEGSKRKAILGQAALYHKVPYKILNTHGDRLTDKEKRKAEKFIRRYFTFYDNSFGSIDIELLFEHLHYMVYNQGIKYILLDHINMIISGTGGKYGSTSERELIDYLMTELASFVTKSGAHIFAIAHLNRNNGKGNMKGAEISMSDLRGSAGLEQLSYNIITLARDMLDDALSKYANIGIIKNREWGELGFAGELEFNSETGWYEDRTYDEDSGE